MTRPYMTTIFYCGECDQRYGGNFPRPAPGNRCQDCGQRLAAYETGPNNYSRRIADRIDGYDRDDLGESPDF